MGNFVFSDRYSVFDWGEMPDHILNKCRALAFRAGDNFEELERRGIKSHYRGLVTDGLEPGSPAAGGPGPGGGKLLRFSDLPESSAGAKLADPVMQIKLARVYYPVAREFCSSQGGREVVYDYSFFDVNRGRINNYLIGLEIIFRNGLPLGSSVFSSLERAAMISDRAESRRRQAEILKGLGLDHLPKAGEMLPAPVMNYTTKLESGDRTLTEEEALFISGLEEGEFRKLSSLALRVNDCITELADRLVSGTLTARSRLCMITVFQYVMFWAPLMRTVSPLTGSRSARRFCGSGIRITSLSLSRPVKAAKRGERGGSSNALLSRLNLPAAWWIWF